MSSDNEDEEAPPAPQHDIADDAPATESENGEEEPLAVNPFGALPRERRSSRHIWLISYSDFMTILMIFFLAMYGYTYMAKQALAKAHPQFSEQAFSNQLKDMREKLGGQLKIQENVDKVVIELSDKILFDSGRADLNSAAGATLDDLAKSVKLIDGDVIVEGHTDNVPISGTHYKSNWELSAARSFSVINALTARGVPSERLAAWGFGEHRPVAANSSDANRAQNRRIEVVILKKKQQTV